MITKIWDNIQRIGHSAKNILSFFAARLTRGTSVTIRAGGELLACILALVIATVLVFSAGFIAILRLTAPKEQQITLNAVTP